MRRSTVPAMVRVDPATTGPFVRVERGPNGLRLAPAAPPAGAEVAEGPPMRLSAAAPFAAREVSVVAAGRLVLAGAPGVAATFRAPELHAVHDRRPPGLDRVIGAPLANAGLLRSDSGWRAVVLPSLGDLVAELGSGPVALRADGRRVAAVRDGDVWEHELGGEGVVEQRQGGGADALAYDGAGTLRAADGVVALAGAAGAERVLALHPGNTLTLAGARDDTPLAAWPAPIPGVEAIALSADGALAALGAPSGDAPAACVVRARDGALVRHVAGARALALAPDGDAIAIAGDWGVAWLKRPEEPE